MSTLTLIELEDLYDELARALDDCKEGQENVFLAKLTLRLANELGDPGRVSQLIAECRQRPAPQRPVDGRIL